MSYFNSVVNANKIIVGQQCGNGRYTQSAYLNYVEALRTRTKKSPALIGVDYGFLARNNLAEINETILAFWRKGGLVTINWSAANPWSAIYNPRWNSAVFKNQIDLKALLKSAPETVYKNRYWAELKRVGIALVALQKAGVTVIWRPFHEMNGTWFWYGVNDRDNPTNRDDYVALWKDMYAYFVNDLKLNNLIWVYSPNITNNAALISYDYPGTQYVDIVGVDIYTAKPAFHNYSQLKQFNKPIAVTEVGPNKEAFGNFDEMDILNAFKGKAIYFLQWSSFQSALVSIIDNPRYKEMLNDESAITLDKLNK